MDSVITGENQAVDNSNSACHISRDVTCLRTRPGVRLRVIHFQKLELEVDIVPIWGHPASFDLVMPPYEDWNNIDDEEDEELQDASVSYHFWGNISVFLDLYVQQFEGKRDVILFCIDCSESMLALRDDPNYENVQTCHVYSALEAAMQIQKKKIIVGPNDSVGIILFNTVRISDLLLSFVQ